MANEISKITLPSGVTYDIKDTVARQSAAGSIILKGGAITEMSDGSTTTAIKVAELLTEQPSDWTTDYTNYYYVDPTTKTYKKIPEGSGAPEFEVGTYYKEKSITAKASDAVFYGAKEYVFDGTIWHEFGDNTGLGAFAFADTGSVTFTGDSSDNVLGETTTFVNAPSAVTFTGGGSDSVLGADTTLTNAPSAVTFQEHTKATVLKSTVTATVPHTAGTTKYLTASTTLGTETGTRTDNTPMWGATVDANETLSFTFKPMSTALNSSASTSAGAATYVESVGADGTDSVTFDTTDNTAQAITVLGAATAAAQQITVGDDDLVTAITDIGTGTAAAQVITVGTNDIVSAVTNVGTGTAYPTT